MFSPIYTYKIKDEIFYVFLKVVLNKCILSRHCAGVSIYLKIINDTITSFHLQYLNEKISSEIGKFLNCFRSF